MDEMARSKRRKQLRDMFTDLITAFGRKDFDHFQSYFTEETIFDWPYLPLKEFPSRMVGISAFVATSKAGMADSDPYNHKVDQFYDQADTDMLIVEYHSDTLHHPSGKRYANNYLGIIRFDGEKVSRWKEYINPLPVLEVYGSDFQNDAISQEQGKEA